MVSYEKPYDGSPPQSDDGSHNEKALTRQEKEPSSREFDVYGDESHADSAFINFSKRIYSRFTVWDIQSNTGLWTGGRPLP